ncbi:RHS repeat domain-containing protein [Fibrobacter sp.]|uniref:RHS repeat domain-containing protein n=1 Tax=Fibrobacter sp. TaxID=35828 RepID=UPI00388F5165
MGNNITVTYTYHISGALKSATAVSKSEGVESGAIPLYSETLYYEDCGSADCKAQYGGNISQMTHYLANQSNGGDGVRDVSYIYDAMNRLERVKNDDKNLNMDEFFAYDAQGRIVQQLRGSNASEPASKSDAGKYAYIENTNMLKSVSDGMGESADKRSMADGENFEYDRDGNLTVDHSKYMTIAYDWRGMPVEFKRLDKCYDIHEQIICDSVKLDIAYDGSGRRISKTSLRKNVNSDDWTLEQITHYTGIGSEIRKEYHNGELQSTKVVVNMPQGLGRYGIENADGMAKGDEFYLKNHLGSTMMVAQVSSTNAREPAKVAAAYDYRAFGEQVTLTESADKVTENFTGKELDDETELDYFGARYLDPMLGMWTSVDPARQFSSPYLYAGNGYNPIIGVDDDGNEFVENDRGKNIGQDIYDKLVKVDFFGSEI